MRDDLTKTSAVNGHPSSFEIILLVVLLGFFLILPERAEGVFNLIGSLTKPDSVTQTRCTQLRTTPTDRLAPGFDPSKLLSHSFPGEIGGTAAIDSALELFVVLGPGEITGNPFDQLLNSTIRSEMGGPIGHECQGLNHISLGRAKFNTATQRDIPPSAGRCFYTGPDPDVKITASSSPSSFSNPPPYAQIDCPANDTAGYLHNNFIMQGDFFPFQLIHVGFDSIINFEAVPAGTTSPKTLVPYTAPAGWTCVNSSQTVRQVTGVLNDLGTGFFSAPGVGDQVVVNNVAAWSVQSKGDLKFTSPTIVGTTDLTCSVTGIIMETQLETGFPDQHTEIGTYFHLTNPDCVGSSSGVGGNNDCAPANINLGSGNLLAPTESHTPAAYCGGGDPVPPMITVNWAQHITDLDVAGAIDPNQPATFSATMAGLFQICNRNIWTTCNQIFPAVNAPTGENQTRGDPDFLVGTDAIILAILWSTQNIDPAGAPSSGAATCGSPINGVAQTTGGNICVHWHSDYEDSPCKIVGAYDPNVGPNNCRGVATGYGFLDVSEGYSIYDGDAAASTPASYPLGPQASFGIINGAASPYRNI